jgi:PAS domain-containing protein
VLCPPGCLRRASTSVSTTRSAAIGGLAACFSSALRRQSPRCAPRASRRRRRLGTRRQSWQTEAKQRAKEMSDPRAKADFSNTEGRWLFLARSYQLSDSLKDFIRAIPDRSSAASTLADVAARPRSAQALRAPEDDLQKVLDRTPFMLTRCSSGLPYQFVSRAYAEMIGLQPSVSIRSCRIYSGSCEATESSSKV